VNLSAIYPTRVMKYLGVMLIAMGMLMMGKGLACACCADEGEWFEGPGDVREFKLINDLKFRVPAFLLQTRFPMA